MILPHLLFSNHLCTIKALEQLSQSAHHNHVPEVTALRQHRIEFAARKVRARVVVGYDNVEIIGCGHFESLRLVCKWRAQGKERLKPLRTRWWAF